MREAAFTQTSRALAKWDPVVQQNRRAEQQVFPLQQQAVTVAPVEEVISSWQVGALVQVRPSMLSFPGQRTGQAILSDFYGFCSIRFNLDI